MPHSSALSAIDRALFTDMWAFLDGYCSTVQGLLDWFEVDLGFSELSFIQIDTDMRGFCHN